MKVVVTIFPIYDLTRRIAGPDADVLLLVPPGRPEVDFIPTEAQLLEVVGTKLGIYVGLGLDDWLPDLLDQGAPRARRLSVGDRVPTLVYAKNPVAAAMTHEGQPEVDPHFDGKPDPHVWLDPSRAALIGKAITEEMAKADPSRAAGYRQRSSELQQDLERLDRDVVWKVQNWTSRSFVAFRPAFAYFASHYHLEIVATLEAYPGVVPPMHYQQAVSRVIREKGIQGVFREPQFAPKPATIASTATHVPVGVLDAIGGLEATDTYDKLIRFDIDALDKVMRVSREPSPESGTSESGAVDAEADAGSGG